MTPIEQVERVNTLRGMGRKVVTACKQAGISVPHYYALRKSVNNGDSGYQIEPVQPPQPAIPMTQAEAIEKLERENRILRTLLASLGIKVEVA